MKEYRGNMKSMVDFKRLFLVLMIPISIGAAIGELMLFCFK